MFNLPKSTLKGPFDEFTCFTVDSFHLVGELNPHKIYIFLDLSPLEWNLLWSIKEFLPIFDKKFSEIGNDLYEFPVEILKEDISSQNFILTIDIEINEKAYQLSLEEMLIDISRILYETYEKTIKNLRENSNSNTIFKCFDFPDEVKTVCVQYLQYFYEFLKDVGIQAKVALSEQDSGEILFSVTPEDKAEALDNIREALQVYLHLPVADIELPDLSDVRIQMLHGQILSYQSQVMLQSSIIEQKNATIEQKNLTIHSLKHQLLTPAVLIESQKGKDKEAVPLVGRWVEVGQIDLFEGALTINAAKGLRDAKNTLNLKNLIGLLKGFIGKDK